LNRLLLDKLKIITTTLQHTVTYVTTHKAKRNPYQLT